MPGSRPTWAKHSLQRTLKAPPDVDVLGPGVSCGNLPPEQRGFGALGVPTSHPDFAKEVLKPRPLTALMLRPT